MFYFGIDWSHDFHVLCILNEAGARLSRSRFAHSLTGFQQVESERRKLDVPAAECLVGIETAHNLLVDFLLDHEYSLYVIPPRATDGYRNRQRLSGAYDDDSDAALLAGIVRTDRGSHRRLLPPSPLVQQLRGQVRLIESLRQTIHRQSQQLLAALERCYPQALGLFGDLTAQISLRFLMAYPTAQAAQALSREDFAAFCHAQGYTRTDLIPRRYAHLTAPAPHASPAVAQAYQPHIRLWAEFLLPEVQARQQALAELDRLFSQHPDAFIFASLPGCGDLLGPALLAKFGDQRERFAQPREVQALAGTCPVTERSGKKKFIHFRYACDKEFRRIAQHFALASLSQATWASAYWQAVRPRCASDSHALRCLANRWLAIIWTLWQTRQAYDEAYHLRQRARRSQPKS